MGPKALVALVGPLVLALALCSVGPALVLVIELAYFYALAVQAVQPLRVLLGEVLSIVASVGSDLWTLGGIPRGCPVLLLALTGTVPFVSCNKHEEGS